jgi:hypothetical protein
VSCHYYPGSRPAASRLPYFSLVAQSTLGYGDIVPGNAFAQVLVIVKAPLGQFYLAVLGADLVGALLNCRSANLSRLPDQRGR